MAEPRHKQEAMVIGQVVVGGRLELDLPALVATRLLIQANSGGGKSWLLRLIAERAGIQTIVLDNEGEFASLREAVDMLLVGANGELRANPRHAALLARRLLEFKVSAVIDLYEMKLAERRRFVKLFLDSLIHLPRDLWRPTLVILDEAHIYCPERGSGEAESTEAVISLMSQGRKRGYAGIIATQRLSKLHKDAAAEANNVIIGRTWLDADQARAGDALGLSKADRLKLRHVEQGEFYAFGPALSWPGVVRFRSDQVRTTHPRPGQRHLLTAPAPSQAIRGVLGKFADLPQEAEEEARSLDESRRRIAELEHQIKSLKSARPAPAIDRDAIERAVMAAV
jgi:DNA helicase HerA-like ATPase